MQRRSLVVKATAAKQFVMETADEYNVVVVDITTGRHVTEPEPQHIAQETCAALNRAVASGPLAVIATLERLSAYV